MGRSKRFETRAGMLLYIGFALLLVSTSAVSTFAWFTSRQRATVNSTQLTVKDGLQYKFFAYKGNFAGASTANPVSGYFPSQISGFDLGSAFTDNFVEITSSNQAAYTGTGMQGMWPGQRLTFAIVVSEISLANATITVNSFSSAHHSSLKGRLTSSDAYQEIDMAWATNLYCAGYSNKDLFAKFLGLKDSADADLSPVPFGVVIGDSQTTISTAKTTPFLLGKGAKNSNNEVAFFYSLEFSNINTTYFSLVTAPTESDSNTYYQRDKDNGNSQCYSGLSFALSSLYLNETDS